MVSARACANQFLPYSSSDIALFGMRTVQADSCSNSEQIKTLFISVGVRKGVGGGGSFWAGGPQFTRACQELFLRLLACVLFSAGKCDTAPAESGPATSRGLFEESQAASWSFQT